MQTTAKEAFSDAIVMDSVYCLDTCTPCGIGLYSWILFVHQREADHLTTSMIALDPQKKQQVSLI